MASSKAIATSVLVLRMIALSGLVACIILIVTDNYKLSGGQKEHFTNLHAYRYVLATALIGLAYTLLQIPLAIYYVCTEKRLIRGEVLLTIDFYGDKIISFLLATGVGAGFATGIEFKRITREYYNLLTQLGFTNLDEWKSKSLHFFNRGNIATSLLLLAFISTALISILSSIILSTRSSGRQSFFFS